jgi:CrcB protein
LVVVITLLAGALGAVARYGVTLAFARTPARLPLAVLIVNVVGSFIGGGVVGLVSAGVIGADIRLILLSGLAGGLTTFSTFGVETVQLIRESRLWTAALSVVLNLVLGITAALVGYSLGALVTP